MGAKAGDAAGRQLGRHLRRRLHRGARSANKAGIKLAHAHLQLPQSVPRATSARSCQRYKRVIVPELNMGQLRLLLAGTFGIPVQGINKVQGKPFNVSYLASEIRIGSWRPRNDHDHARPASEPLTRKDFASPTDIRWCPGCGDYSILAQ